MNAIQSSDRPRLAAGCRLSDAAAHEATLAVPEGAIRLNGPALKIVQYCDGQRSFGEIVQLLQSDFANDDAERIAQDATNFLEALRAKRVITVNGSAE
jgi:coenzyme PQQ biosynthesis protein PqqD